MRLRGYNRNISKLITFIFRNETIFWDILKWNRGQTKWHIGSIYLQLMTLSWFLKHYNESNGIKIYLKNSLYIYLDYFS